MIPEFDNDGNLPPGIHPCSMKEVAQRFGHGSAERAVETAELSGFVDWARKAGVARLVADGSYATTKPEPNDVDIVILPGPRYPENEDGALAQSERWPFLHIIVAVDEPDLNRWIEEDFGVDRSQRRRGVLEILL